MKLWQAAKLHCRSDCKNVVQERDWPGSGDRFPSMYDSGASHLYTSEAVSAIGHAKGISAI